MSAIDREAAAVITGPTAAGKSAIAARVARLVGGEIVCADSRQVYRGMPVASAHPSAAEFSAAPHHLYGTVDPSVRYTAGLFRDDARRVMAEIRARSRLPMLVGGTGMYIRAALGVWRLAPPARTATIRELSDRLDREGSAALWEELRGVDPASAARINRRDAFRIARALAVFRDTGRPFSSWRADAEPPAPATPQFAVSLPREALYRRIDDRCAVMLESGALDEARRFKAAGLDPRLPSLRAIGFRHLFDVLEGAAGEEEALARIRRDTRRYAKRQMTWLRAQPGLVWVDGSDPSGAADRVAEALSRRPARRGAPS